MTTDDDAPVLTLLASGDASGAVELALRQFGREVLTWQCSRFESEADAYDAFSRFSEQLWRSFETFEGRCSVRTWCYMLAHQAVLHVRARDPRERELPRSQLSSVAELLWASTRSERERRQQLLDELRASLDDDDQVLLVLRVDRRFSWLEITRILHGEQALADEATRARHAAALRKRFERIKQHLRTLARERE